MAKHEHNRRLGGSDWVARKKLYDDRLGFTGMPPSEANAARQRALCRAHEMRKFEIENYWKRSTYFWGFQIVTFGALAFAVKDGSAQPGLTVPASMLGIITAIAALLSASGSKFWQENWEGHVDFLEDDFEGRLHKTALVRDKLSPSVSRVNERLLEVILFGWILCLLAALVTLICPTWLTMPLSTGKAFLAVFAAYFGTSVACCHIFAEPPSRLEGRAFNIMHFDDLAEPADDHLG